MSVPRFCLDLSESLDERLSREWLVTNGIGGYASSTLVGANVRRYHGLLVASLPPPFGRHVLLSKLDEEVVVGDRSYLLGCNEYEGGVIYPDGHRYMVSFWLELGIPVAEYRFGSSVIQKRIWMEHGQNTVYVMYRLCKAPREIEIRLRPFCAFRGYHGPLRRGSVNVFSTERAKDSVVVSSHDFGCKLRILSPECEFREGDDWYWHFLYRVEAERGLDSIEDLFTPGLFSVTLHPGQQVLLVATSESGSIAIDGAWEREVQRRRQLTRNESDPLRLNLLLAADQFVVDLPCTKPRKAILAGYHWFTDWGRDTMIALPGILLSTRRFREAEEILVTWAEAVDQGMLPNRFTDDGAPEYNSVDAALWLFQCIHKFLLSTNDRSLLKQIFPRLVVIIGSHVEGTRFGVHMDKDGLLNIGWRDTQLTWMDACVDGFPVTPRFGKPVEINALWYNALNLMTMWARRLGASSLDYESLSTLSREGFCRLFWYKEGGYLYDVVNEDGADTSLRPNQILAVSLAYSPLDHDRQKAVVDAVGKHLLTPYGLRTLSRDDPRYSGTYSGGPRERDLAYHQGPAWPWLLGHYADAHYRVYRDLDFLVGLARPFEEHISDAGIGTISELFDGDPPYTPRGCIAQAWSVGEILRILTNINAID